MKNFLSSFFNKGNDQDPDKSDLPWLHSTPIYEHIYANLDPDSSRLSQAGATLPDEERRFADSTFRWAPGAIEGAFGAFGDSESNNEAAEAITKHLLNIAEENSLADKIAVYNLLLKDDILGFIDLALKKISSSNVSPFPNIYDFAQFLAKDAPDRGPVKFAIALLGVIHGNQDIDTIKLLGLHDEFTLYSAVALSNKENGEQELWELAKKVDGWGRIQIVERLANTESPEIKEWMLREGYQNSIMVEYLAHTCATTGDLKSAISTSYVDEGLLDATSDILQALLFGGPAKDIHDYKDAAVVVTHYLKHIQIRSDNLKYLILADLIIDYLTNDSWNMVDEIMNGWDEEIMESAIQICENIIQKAGWRLLIDKGLQSEDDYQFHLANRAAKIFNIDTWEYHWNRIQNEPLNVHYWYSVMIRTNSFNIQKILDFAQKVLPLDMIATGPAEEMGIGENSQVYRCLDFIVQELRRFPGLGWPLIATSLKSPVIRNRNMAIRALATWDHDHITMEVEKVLRQALAAEPRDDIRERIEKVLNGEPLDGQ